MLIESIAFFLAIAIIFYALFAGADFGGGLLELMLGRNHRSEQRHLIDHAIGPVWEANHVWLILAVVILFNGFPRAYAELSTAFHIPLTIMLIGIILRGCAFTFKHYDAVRDRSQVYYMNVFRLSSLLTPFMLGVIAAGTMTRPAGDFSFFDVYVERWFTPFAASLGIFTCVLFAFLAAVYLIGEAPDDTLRSIFRSRARALNMTAVVSGATVIACAEQSGVPLANLFLARPMALACVITASLAALPLWHALATDRYVRARVLAGSQLVAILSGWLAVRYPELLAGRDASITIYNSAAPAPVLRVLLIALIVGCAFILPALFFLLRVFKRQSTEGGGVIGGPLL